MNQVQVRRQLALITLANQLIYSSDAIDQCLEALSDAAVRTKQDGATTSAWNAFQAVGRALVEAEAAVADAATAWGEAELYATTAIRREVPALRLLKQAAGLIT